jgi:RNA recognition motif-containing protein
MSKQYYPQNNGYTLWMGDIEDFMDERFINTSFNLIGFKLSSVKVIRNKITGQPIGYGFVSFESEEIAQKVLHEYNGQQIPNAAEGKKFRLNNTSAHREENEYSIYVGDLTPDVDDYTLLAAFAAQYPSTCSAKVMLNEGQSKGFGFVRFSNESDYRAALSHSQTLNLLGPKAIHVRAAKPRRRYQNNFKRNAPFVGQEVPVPQQAVETPEAVYAPDVNPYYNGVTYPITGTPYWVYGFMPYNPPNNALQYGQYDPYVYGQQMYAQPYYQVCDNYAYPMTSQTYVDHGHNQYIDSDKLNDEMIAKNEVLFVVCFHFHLY